MLNYFTYPFLHHFCCSTVYSQAFAHHQPLYSLPIFLHHCVDIEHLLIKSGVSVIIMSEEYLQSYGLILQTTTGVIYKVWTRDWTAHVLHQGPSERVTGVALSSSTTYHHPLLAATTHHHYLLVAALPKVKIKNLKCPSFQFIL